ncbi:MAG: SLC13 family permease [Archangium sp.]|nr:SLC13 family permease [Archangium sp.]MDP3570625.1 SLC13 family permease [Archangium sp.]
MNAEQLLFAALLICVIVLQAALPSLRLLIVLAGGALTCLACVVLKVATVAQLFADVPWDVLVILVALGLYAERLADSRLFGLASVGVTRLAGARPVALTALFSFGTYLVSGVVNNITALLVVLPVLLSVFALIGVTRRYTTWTLGLMLVACNLGGAATPIGDFPAVLLLGRGTLSFREYLAGAVLPTFLAVWLLIGLVVLFVRPARDVVSTGLSRRLTLATLGALYRGVKLDWASLWPALVAMALMLAGWLLAPASWGLTPELVCWVGAGVALLAQPRSGERLLRTRVDVESALFLLALFLMVAAVRRTGLFTEAARWLTSLPLPPLAQVVVFLVVAAVSTGLFSAGPSMAALLEVADVLSKQHPAEPIYIGLALSVCAGSSLFLTAATSGPLTQSLVERSKLKDLRGERVRFGFTEFLPVGLLGFSVILLVNIARTVWALSAGGAP